MARKNQRSRSSDGYHHGDLRRALLDEGLKLASELGPSAFSLAQVAARAGVSHAAPYRHFASREELLSALTAESFGQLEIKLRKATTHSAALAERVIAMAYAYLDFAVASPARYELMFGGWIERGQHQALEAAFQRAFLPCIEMAGMLLSPSHGHGDPTAALQLAKRVWAYCHGVASLAANQVIKADKAALNEMLKVGLLDLTNSAKRSARAARRARL